MKRSLILSDAEREARKELVQQNRLKRAQGSLISVSNPPKNDDRTTIYLSASDHELMRNIFNAYENTCGVVGKYRYEYFPPTEHSAIHTFFNDFCDRHKSLVEYFKMIPEFTQLSMDDRIRLLRNHFGTMLNINESIVGGHMMTNLANSIQKIFHPEIAGDVLRATELLNVYRSDPILLKLILVVRSLSSGINRYRRDTDMSRVFDNPRAIFHGQNIYTELLWRYILARSPSDRDAVRFFNKLILDLLFLQRACYKAGSYIYDLEDEIDRMSPLMQCMWPRPEKPDLVPLTELETVFSS